VTIFLTGCTSFSDPETSQDYIQTSVAVVNPDQTVGQTFVARRARLTAIDIWLQTDQHNQSLTLELFHSIGDLRPIFTADFVATNGKLRIDIPPQDSPPEQSYYFRLKSTNGEVRLLGRDEDNYPWGTATRNDQPIDADIAFRTLYKYDTNSTFTDIKGLLLNIPFFILISILLFLPGWLILDFTNLNPLFDFGERIALSLGFSLAVIPLAMLWTSFFNVQWGPISVWLASGMLVGTLAYRWYRSIDKVSAKWSKEKSEASTQIAPNSNLPLEIDTAPPPSRFSLHTIILITLFTFSLFIRFAMVRDLAAPPWVDSIHHGLITRLMMESGGLPDTYLPYLPSEADYYHFGFHSVLSTFIWMTGIEIHNGMLILGQVLNALIIFAVYLLVITLTKNRAAALTGAFMVGALTLMPAYYTSWGRYTQLTGLLILPAGFSIFVNLLKEGNRSTVQTRGLWVMATITFAGLFLVHYRVAAFLGLLIFAYLVAQVPPKKWSKTMRNLIYLGFFSGLLLILWLPNLITNLLLPKGEAWSGGSASLSQIPWNFLKPGLGIPVLIMAGIGLIFGFILLRRFTITILLWVGLMYLLANMRVLGIPGSGFINPVSMEITLFMPIAVAGGFSIGGTLELIDKILPTRFQVASRGFFLILGVVVAVLGAQRLLPILNPTTFLARKADFPAIDWIDTHISQDEIIMINPTRWGYGLYMGNDGGYWISPLTGIRTLPPPVLYGLGKKAEVDYIHQAIERVLTKGDDAMALWELMQSENIRFVFSGRRGGIISPRALTESELFLVRYQQAGTWIFEAVE
jgi:hypothetical protein